MNDRSLVTAGIVGAAFVALCCATPFILIALGSLGVTAWIAHADTVVIAILLVAALVLIAGFVLRRARSRNNQFPKP